MDDSQQLVRVRLLMIDLSLQLTHVRLLTIDRNQQVVHIRPSTIAALQQLAKGEPDEDGVPTPIVKAGHVTVDIARRWDGCGRLAADVERCTEHAAAPTIDS